MTRQSLEPSDVTSDVTYVHRPLLDHAPDLPFLPIIEAESAVQPLDAPGHKGTLLYKSDARVAAKYAGNKARKLEFLLADAKRRGYRSIWTVGALGSNHALATTTHARALGFDVDVLHFPQPPTAHVLDNLRAVAAQGARCQLVPKNQLPAWIARLRLADRVRPGDAKYYIPAGGSSPIGVLGFVNAGLALAAQLPAEPGTVYTPVGTAGTLVGLCLGLAIANRTDITVQGIRVIDRIAANRFTVMALFHGTRRLLGQLGVSVGPSPPWILRQDHFGAGYGITTPAADRAQKVAAELGLYTETTYSAKALAACLDDPPTPGWRLYWHTVNGRDVTQLTAGFSPEMLPDNYQPYFQGESS